MPRDEVANFAEGVFVSEKNWPAAEAEFSKAAASDGEDSKLAGFRFDVITERGNVRFEEKRIALALSDYADVLGQCPGCSGTFRNRARLFRSERRFGEAAADLSQSIAINMRAGTTFNQRGLLYFKLNNLPLAIVNYSEAIRLNPDNESAYKNRAEAFAKSGRQRDAQADRAMAAAVETKQAAKKKLMCERTEPETQDAATKSDAAEKDSAGAPANASRLDDKALAELFTGKRWEAVQGIWSVEMEFRADGSFVQRSKDMSQGGTPVAVIAGMWAATDNMLCIYTNQGLCMTGREDKGAISLRRKDGTLEYAGVVSALKAIDVSNATVPIAEFPLDEKFLPGTQTAAATGKTLLYFIGGFDGANRPARIHGVVQRYFVAQMQKTQGWDVIDADYPFTYNSQYRSSEAATYGVAAYLQRRIKELKAQGYERIFVGGQSFGSWVSLIVSTERNMPVDAIRDSMGRIISVTAKGPGSDAPLPVVSNITYQPFGEVSGLTYGNGVVETRQFDLDYRLTRLAAVGKTTLQDLTYGYDAAGNVGAITDGVTPGDSQTFSYDTLDRLTSAKGSYGLLGYTYDALGNRLTETNGQSTDATYVYAPHSNRLAEVRKDDTAEILAYSPTGSVTGIDSGAGSVVALAYNNAGRLAGVTASGQAVAGYGYDAFGQRLVKSRPGSPSAETVYQYDQGRRLLAEDDASGGPKFDHIYLDDRPIAQLSPDRGNLYFVHSDRLGTPQRVTETSQGVVWAASYEPFGATALHAASVSQSLRFSGQYFDAETGFDQNEFRDYEPNLGRYVESDPIGLGGGLNTYVYVMDAPFAFTDRTGMGACYTPKDAVTDELSNLLQQQYGLSKTFADYLATAMIAVAAEDEIATAELWTMVQDSPKWPQIEAYINQTVQTYVTDPINNLRQNSDIGRTERALTGGGF